MVKGLAHKSVEFGPFLNTLKTSSLINKRAQRALGRSPEEKVNGQGEAIYRGPLMLSTKFWSQGHNLHNFGRGPLDDAIYQIWKLRAL